METGWGLSPPTRGNLERDDAQSFSRGSIPAHAGEPERGTGWRGRGGVYPRPRGGTICAISIVVSSAGLSPPTRGNLAHHLPLAPACRSIPAHAGEPSLVMSTPSKYRVYPRPRGGTVVELRRVETNMGLSPPTRGNQRGAFQHRTQAGSIPAHAGEPCKSTLIEWTQTVYPRPRGGTALEAMEEAGAQGLSPPTRGNPPPAHPA